MTVLVAQNTKDKIILAADSGAFYGDYHKVHLHNHKGRLKIAEVNNIFYASTGLVAEINNFRLFCSSKKPETPNEVGIQRFFVDFAKFLKEMNLRCDNPHSIIDNSYFLVYEKRLFHYQCGGVQEILEGDFATDGAGFKEAYMAMYLGKTPKEAIDLTIEMNVWTSGKAQIVEIGKK
jgi:hypothetical protein